MREARGVRGGGEVTRPLDADFARRALAIVNGLAELASMQPIEAREQEQCALERDAVLLMTAYESAAAAGAATKFKLARRLADA